MSDSGIVISGPDRANQHLDADAHRRVDSTLVLRPRVELAGVTEDASFAASFGGLIAQEEAPVPNMQIAFPYNINDAYVRAATAAGGTVTQANGKAVLQTSANPAGSALIESVGAARYSPGQGQTVRFTAIFTAGVANSHQEIGLGDANDGLFFGYQGATFGIFRRRGGVDDFTPQTAWNVDKMDGRGPSGQTLNPLVGNVYQIRYQWLGFGAIRFFIEDADSGVVSLVHVIRYANANTLPTIFNPSLPLHAHVANLGNATNLTLQTASLGVYSEGPYNSYGARFGIGNRKTGIGAVETNIISLRCDSLVFGGQANRGRLHLDAIAAAITGANDAQVRMILNATLGGAPVFNAVDANRSIASVDIAGTTVAGGRELSRFPSTGNFQSADTITDLEIRLAPGDVITFAGSSFTGNCNFNVCPSWHEEV